MVAAQETPDAEVPPGSLVLGRYQIVGKLAQGGMAEVYLARQVGPGGYQKLVVCKRVRPHLSKDEDFVGMFVNEARLAAMINHPNVVQIFDLGEEQTTVGGEEASDWFLAMEYLDGRDMLQVGRACRAHNKAVPFDVTARIIADACAGLEHAHNLKGADGKSLDLVHRDMSPENIIITFEGQVKVVDFGIAKARDNSIRTQAGQIKGKLGYVAPEAILGKPVDARADIFAVGATLYLFLSGRPAFTGNSPMEIFERSLKPPPSPQEVNPRVPPVLDEICMRALAQDRDKRYRTAGEVRSALDAYLASTGRPLGAPQLAQFMRILFPPDKDPVRQRIDGLLVDAAKFQPPGAKAANAPRTISVPQVPAIPAPVHSDNDRTAIVPPENRRDPQMSQAPQAIDFAAQAKAAGAKAGVGPAHLRSVGVSDDIPDVSNPRGAMPSAPNTGATATVPAVRPPPPPHTDDGKTHVTSPLGAGGRGATVEEPQELHTMDVQRIDDSSVARALAEPTLGLDVEVDDTEAAIAEAMKALEDASEDNIQAGIGNMTMENAPVSSDPNSPATVQSPIARSFVSRMPETGDAMGTELPPPPFEASGSGMRPPPSDSLDGASQPGFEPPPMDQPDLIPVDESRDTGGPGIALRLGAAAIGAVTGVLLLVIVLKIMGHLGTVLGN